MLRILILNLFLIPYFVLGTLAIASSQLHEPTALNIDDLVYVVDDCPHSTYRCNKAKPAKVLAVNDHGMITVQFENNNYGTYNETDLYRTNGCLIILGTKLCVDTNRLVFVDSDLHHIDPSFPWTQFKGHILAINTYTNKAIIESASGGETLFLSMRAYDMDQIKLKYRPF